MKSQVNPHFLFNSLNTLSSLIYDDPKKADDFIHKLSDIYRYILLNEDKKLVLLIDELKFVKDYFSLQEIRDEGKIYMEIIAQNPEDIFIVPISLQVLVENALKHNALTKKKPLGIKIILKNDYVEIRNNLHRKTILENLSKTGLKNLNERIKIISGREIKVFEDQSEFIVNVPIVFESENINY